MKKENVKAKLLFREKLVLRGGLLRDGVIWKVPLNSRYPDGIRYRLALVDIESNQVLALFDNHYPKGHHRHLEDGTESPYRFDSAEKLVEDYLAVVELEEKKRENKKN